MWAPNQKTRPAPMAPHGNPDMLVVNLGTNDEYFIFRGSMAREFLGGLEFISHRQVRVRLAHGRIATGRLSITKAQTFCLVLDAEDINDVMAQLAFDVVT